MYKLYVDTKFVVFDYQTILPWHVTNNSISKSHLQWKKCTILKTNLTHPVAPKHAIWEENACGFFLKVYKEQLETCFVEIG